MNYEFFELSKIDYTIVRIMIYVIYMYFMNFFYMCCSNLRNSCKNYVKKKISLELSGIKNNCLYYDL